MLIMLLGIIITAFVTFIWNVWIFKHGTNESLAWGAMFGLLVGSILGGFAWGIVYSSMEEEVEVRWTLSEGPSGRYLENGTTGEYNDATIIGYYPSGDGVRQFWRYASNSAVATSPNGSAYALLTCPSDETLPDWVKTPWGDDEPNCDSEFITYYIPEGES